MQFKGTAALLIVCLALAGFVYFYEIKGGEQREQAKQAENQLWKVESADIRQMDLIFDDRHITVVRNGEDDWAITAPRNLDADSAEINSLANSAANMRRNSIVEQDSADMARFGLTPPRARLIIKTKDDGEFRIHFGINNPTGNSTYATVPDQGSVFLVSSSLVDSLDKKLDDLRNHSVLSFEQAEVRSLSLKSSKGQLNLVKDSDDRWWIEGEEKVAADSPGVRGILTALSLARIEEFFNDNPKDYRNLGLDRPLVEVSLIGENKAMKRLAVGTEKALLRKKNGMRPTYQNPDEISSSELFLAKNDSREDLFFVKKELVDKLLRSRDDLRDMALASFQRWDIDVIILKNPKGNLTFIKSGGEWFLDDTKKKAKWDAINDILDTMEKPVQEILEKPAALSTYGLEKPAIRIVLKQGSKAIVDSSVGKGANDKVYARVKGDSSVKLVDPEIYDKLDKGESDWVEEAASPTETDAPKN
jgi:hypothetical protein